MASHIKQKIIKSKYPNKIKLEYGKHEVSLKLDDYESESRIINFNKPILENQL